MHNAAFKKLAIKAQFNFYEVAPPDLEQFFIRVREEKIAGLAVSIPYKEAVFAYVDQVSTLAQKVGAINTIYWHKGKLIGDNTDVYGFQQGFADQDLDCKESSALIIGVGGAARAVAYGLKDLGFQQIKVWGRKPEKVQKFATEFAIEPIANLDQGRGLEVIINTTPLGMWPNVDDSPVSANFWSNQRVAYDLVMNPRMTKFLRDAEAKQVDLITGDLMLLYQGARQFEIWLNRKPPIAVMQGSLESALQNKEK
jgi:shikimate dehydrogenase